jgi:S1-C subfamily serine protease
MDLAHLAAAILLVSSPGETVLLDFRADWCGPCVRMDPVVSQLATEGYPVRKLDVDEPINQAKAGKLGVEGYPTFVMMAGGKEVDRQVGACSRERLLEMLQKAGVGPGGKTAHAEPPEPPKQQQLQPVPFPTGASNNPLANDSGAGHGQVDPYAQRDIGPPAHMQAPPTSGGGRYDTLIRASVRLRIEDQTGNSRGSGTIIDAREGEALILTCGHVFREAAKNGQISVDFFGPNAPQGLPGKLVAYDLKSDIGLLSVRTNYPVIVAHLAPASLALKRGDKVISVGCDGGADATARETQVNSINRYREPAANIQVAFQPVQGRSGGGLFTPEGWVVGVCNAADPQDNEGLFAALPVIQEELDEAGLAFIYRDMPAGTHGVADGRLQAAMGRRKAEGGRRTSEAPAWTGGAGQSSIVEAPAVRAPAPANQFAQATPPTSGQLSADEQATLNLLRAKSQDAEVVCIIRPKGNPNAKSEIIVLDRASPEFIRELTGGREPRGHQRLTSLESPTNPSQTNQPPASTNWPAERSR